MCLGRPSALPQVVADRGGVGGAWRGGWASTGRWFGAGNTSSSEPRISGAGWLMTSGSQWEMRRLDVGGETAGPMTYVYGWRRRPGGASLRGRRQFRLALTLLGSVWTCSSDRVSILMGSRGCIPGFWSKTAHCGVYGRGIGAARRSRDTPRPEFVSCRRI